MRWRTLRKSRQETEESRATSLMPMLSSLGEHPALEAIQRRLQDDEKLLAHLDRPDRVCAVIGIISEELARHAHISIHHGKTQVWNRGGIALTRVARLVKPEAVGWRGGADLSDDTDVLHLGVPTSSVGREISRARDVVPPDS